MVVNVLVNVNVPEKKAFRIPCLKPAHIRCDSYIGYVHEHEHVHVDTGFSGAVTESLGLSVLPPSTHLREEPRYFFPG